MSTQVSATKNKVQQVDTVTIRFVGDSGDGMQLTGTEFTKASALAGNDLATFPDYPAEIRAPAGSLAGVSGYQVNFGSREIHTPGDAPDVLVAMNPAALKTNLADLRQGGMLIVNAGAFTASNLEKAGYKTNPLEDATLKANFKVFLVDMTKLTESALDGSGLSSKEVGRCRNYFALGLLYWLYSRPMEQQLEAIAQKFVKKPEFVEPNQKVFKAGYAFGETSELFFQRYHVPPSKLAPGTYRNVTGNFATALGFATVARLTGRQVFLGSYPITPATEILQEMANFKEHGVVTYQAEDEIAGVGSAIGAAFGGALACTSTSGPGLALKSEMMGLAVITELPLVIVNVQRGGPSTGMPTKTEQADLLMALFGRHGEAPMPIIAAQSPADCFWSAIEAMKIAYKWMTPVLLLTDGYLGNGSEPFKIPAPSELPKLEVKYQTELNYANATQYMPYLRDAKLVRPWAIPGTPGLEHRVGGLEKDSLSGMVSYDGMNHEKMVKTRAQKIRNVVEDVPDVEVFGAKTGDLLLVSWGGTFGSVRGAAEELQAQGKKVSHVHLRWINPLPKNLGDVLKGFKKVLVPEVNDGQLAFYLRGMFPGVNPLQYNRINGKPIKIAELVGKVVEAL
ncbi:2-oxoacid:acceptor oxidoreductase subunit alpha [Anaeromyxobacter oryzae]|uniref:2-oxoglutarate ferredoxin oxidoreductase subunit alpha n=1 Tax=Anaeromyxobacter oryzae TaxID=2918170 RepID=A0ABM7X4U0_9BACT|nr:2-oxoacid:acceptor oxidoreductase subunit alpha [Anaeromyxobacter oryzae]BDG06795.1 2-oxoglutarate ferredoxin oxidoreductase subunit alpha [Anaeromyxobacter oryzae]